MKTANMIMCAAVMVGIPVGAQSATIPCTMTPSCSGVVSYERVGKFCATYKEAGGYYNNSGEKICFMECDTCSRYTSRTAQTVSLDPGHFDDLNCNAVYINTCVPAEECPSGTYGFVNVAANPPMFSCQNCPTGSTTLSPGASDISQCVCSRGYYGTISEEGDKCTRCPAVDNIYGTTADFGATSISECYIPAGTTGRDASGTFTYTSNCYWKQ